MIWLGDETSLQSYLNLQKYLANPTEGVKPEMSMHDDDDDDKPWSMGRHLLQVVGNLAIITIDGGMARKFSFWNRYFGVVSYEEIRDAFALAHADDEVEHILVLVESGGGEASGLHELSDFIKLVAKDKPVYSHTSSNAYSAGYWVLSTARKISASKMTGTGSIGVIVVHTSYARLLKEEKIDVTVFRAGKYKALGHPTEKLSELAIEKIENEIGILYGYFLAHSTEMRPALSIGNKDDWAEGRTFYEEEALKQGLIDEIAPLDAIVAKLLRKSNNSSTSNLQYNSTRFDGDTDMAKKKFLSEQDKALLASGVDVNAPELTVDGGGDAIVDAKVSDEKIDDKDKKPIKDEVVDSKLEDDNGESKDTKVDADPVVSDTSQLIKLAGDNALLNQQVTNLTGEMATMKEDSAKLDETITKLSVIAQGAVTRLSIGINTTAPDMSAFNPEQLIKLYEDTNAKFEKTFPTGAKSELSNDVQNENGSSERFRKITRKD